MQQTRDTSGNESEAEQVQNAVIRSAEPNPQSTTMIRSIDTNTNEQVAQRPNPVNKIKAVQDQNAVMGSAESGLPSTAATRSIESDIIEQVAQRSNSMNGNPAAHGQNTVTTSADSSGTVDANNTHNTQPPSGNNAVEPTSRDASLNDVNRHETTGPLKVKLFSKRHSRNYELWLWSIAAIGMAALQLMFWNGVVSSRMVLLLFRKIDSRWSVFLIALMGTIMTAVLNFLITATFESMKWSLSLREPGGVSVLDFIALSQSTSLWTLAQLTWPWTNCRGSGSETGRSRFRIYSLMR